MEYKREFFAQHTAYLQWLKGRDIVKDKEHKDTGKQVCVFPFSSCMDSVKKVLGSRADKEQYYLFFNADGRLQEGACELIAEAFFANEDALVVYADEDYYGLFAELYHIEESAFGKAIISEHKEATNGLFRGEPWFKPDFSPDTLESFFYIGNIFAVRGQIIEEMLDTLGEELSLCELVRAISHKTVECKDATHGTNVFVHIPEVLYTNNRLSQKDALDCFSQEAFDKNGVERIGGSRARLGRLSVIIPSKDNPKVLKRCVETLEKCAKNIDYELIVVDNGSSDENRKSICSFLEERGAKYLYQKAEFNFSRMCNTGAAKASGDFLLFLNDDIEVGEPQDSQEWLQKMMRYAVMEHVGAVGMKLHYPDGDLLQHAGITNMGIGPAHKLGGMPDQGNLYHGHNLADYDMLAVTAACMMVSREKFERAGGFDEELAVAYNDVELCFRLYRSGLYNVQINSAFLIHHESLSRGQDTTAEKQARLLQEKQKLYEKHRWASPGAQTPDPFYSPNLVQWEKDAAYNVNYQYPCDKPVQLKPLTVELKPFTKNAKEYRPLLMWFIRRSIQLKLKRTHVRLFELYNKLTGEDRHLFHIDKITHEDGIVTITGWHVLRKRDNAKLTKRFLIFTKHLNFYEAEFFPKLRRDVEAQFAKEHRTKNTALSGICVKFDTAQLPKGQYNIGIVVESRGRRQFMILDHFEL